MSKERKEYELHECCCEDCKTVQTKESLEYLIERLENVKSKLEDYHEGIKKTLKQIHDID